MAVAHSSSGGVAVRYVLPVLCRTSRLAVICGEAGKGWHLAVVSIGDQLRARPGWSFMSVNVCCVLVMLWCIVELF